MKALFYTREFPPYVYGGAGVHVEYLAAELAKLIEIDVRSFGDQDEKTGNLTVKGFPYDNPVFDDTDDKLKAVLKTLSTCIHMNAEDIDADVVHCHTWYAHFATLPYLVCSFCRHYSKIMLWYSISYNNPFVGAIKTLEKRTIRQRL